MKLIQFRCPIPQVAAGLQQVMLEQVNTWSRLNWLPDDPNYVSQPFGMEQWSQHTTDPDLYWANWGAIYDNLGDDGRVIADRFFGDGPLQGLLRTVPLLPQFPSMLLEIVDVPNLVEAGYVSPPDTDLP